MGDQSGHGSALCPAFGLQVQKPRASATGAACVATWADYGCCYHPWDLGCGEDWAKPVGLVLCGMDCFKRTQIKTFYMDIWLVSSVPHHRRAESTSEAPCAWVSWWMLGELRCGCVWLDLMSVQDTGMCGVQVYIYTCM